MNVYITIGGQGSRMKQISPIDKHLLYYKDKQIINHILNIFPEAKILGKEKTANRKETLESIKNESDCLIIDCDIIPLGINFTDFDEDVVYAFVSDKNKYGSIISHEGKLLQSNEKENIGKVKCSGAYYIKSMKKLLDSMTDVNSIASGMTNAKIIMENTFIRLGDIEDYYEAI